MILSLTLRGVAALVGSFWEDSDLMASNFRMWDIVVTCFPPMLQPSSEESSSFLAERVTALWRWLLEHSTNKKALVVWLSASRESHLLRVWGDLWAWPKKPDTAPRRPTGGYHVTCGLTIMIVIFLALKVFPFGYLFLAVRRGPGEIFVSFYRLLGLPRVYLGALQPTDHSPDSSIPCLNSSSWLPLI